MTVLWVALGAAIGAPARYLTDRAVQRRHDSVFPWGTLTVNLIGSFVLGLLSAVGAQLAPVVGAAFAGATATRAAGALRLRRRTRRRERA